MSNRSISFLKRFKTERNETNNPCERRSKTPSNRHNSPALKKTREIIELNLHEDYLLKCMNHPMKKATFEAKSSLSEAFCQDCSIRMVKQNMRMIRLTEENLKLRAMFEAEIEKICEYQKKALEMVNHYFETQKEAIKINFLKAKEKSENEKIINLSLFKIEPISQNAFVSKMKELFGYASTKTIEFQKNEPKTQYEDRPVGFTYRHRNALSEIYSESFCESSEKENFDNNSKRRDKTNMERIKASLK